MAGFFTCFGGSLFVLERVCGISETMYTVVFATDALVTVATSYDTSSADQLVGWLRRAAG